MGREQHMQPYRAPQLSSPADPSAASSSAQLHPSRCVHQMVEADLWRRQMPEVMVLTALGGSVSRLRKKNLERASWTAASLLRRTSAGMLRR